jgi:hypothetical protein
LRKLSGVPIGLKGHRSMFAVSINNAFVLREITSDKNVEKNYHTQLAKNVEHNTLIIYNYINDVKI